MTFFKTLAAMLACLMAFHASAYDFEQDGIYYQIGSSGTSALVTYKDTNYNSYSGTVIIPESVTYNGNTYRVVQINPYAFKNSTELKRVVIPNSVSYVMNYAFQGCTGLTNITLPENFYTCYSYAFDGCTNLKSVICLMQSPVSWNATNFPASVLQNATLYVPKGRKSTYQANTGCLGSFTNIEEISCDFVQDAIFYKDLGNDQAEVTYAKRFAEDYSGDITIPSTVTNNGTTYTVTSVGNEAFYDLDHLNSVQIPSTVNKISNYAFYDCTWLTSVNIPEGVTSINYCSFSMCSTLSSINIPSSVTWIAQGAFNYCYNLNNITCKAPEPPVCAAESAFYTGTYTSATLNVPSNAVTKYQEADVWKKFSNITGKDYDFALNGIYYNITSTSTVEVTYKDKNYNYYSGSVSIPSSVTIDGTTYTVTGIGAHAFRQSPNLTAVSIPSTVTYLGYAAFVQCTSLASIYLPNSVNSIDVFCFQGCTALTNVRLSPSITALPRQCFTYCSALQTIAIPASVTEIGPFAFYECSALTNANLARGVKVIYPSAFSYCTSLTQVTIPSSVTEIMGNIFNGCSALQTISVNSANTHYRAIDGVLFSYAADTLIAYPNMHAQVYEIPSTAIAIGESAFGSCNNLTSVTMPQGLRFIDSNAFTACENLQEAVLPQSLEYIGYGAFNGCSQLSAVTIPAAVHYIGSAAFASCTSLSAIDVDPANANFLSDHGVLYTGDGHKLIQYPCARPDKHYSVLNSTDSIGDHAFAYSTAIKSVYLPQSLKDLGYQPFVATSLERVVIDEGLEVIPQYAFYDSEFLQSVYLPSTIKTIEPMAFVYTFSLSDLTIAVNGTAPSINDQTFYGAAYDTPTKSFNIYVPSGMASQYSGKDSWMDQYGTFLNIEPLASGTTFTVDTLNYQVSDNLLNATLTGVTSKTFKDPGIPPKVAHQGNLCTVNMIKDHAFAYCYSMVRAEIPFTVNKIDSYCFYDSRNISKFIMREGLQQIGSYAVSHVNKLPTVTIPASATTVSVNAFTYDPALKSILVADGNPNYTSVDGILFSKDKKQLISFADGYGTQYTVPDGTKVIGTEAFRGATALSSVSLPKYLNEVGGYAFFDCSALTDITVPHGVTTIGNYAFGSCSAMTQTELPATLTSLGYRVFYNVPDLTTLKVKATTPPTCKTYFDSHSGETLETFMADHYTGVNLFVPPGCAQAYRAANTWKKFQNISETEFPAESMRGDVNGDGQVNITDAIALINHLSNSSTIDMSGADTNFDGQVNITDVTVLLNYLLGGTWPQAQLDLWYLIGDNVGCEPWDNQGTASIGSGLLPLYPMGELDENGKGTFYYTGYFNGTDAVMLIHNPGKRDDCWGQNPNGVFYHGGQEISGIKPGRDGHYVIILNTVTDRFYFVFYSDYYGNNVTFTPTTVSMIGYHNDWDVDNNDYDMTPLNPSKENHNWIFRNFTVTTRTELKFVANHDWQYNWGTDAFPWGQGENGGVNVPIDPGTYDVYFNDIRGDYHFIKK